MVEKQALSFIKGANGVHIRFTERKIKHVQVLHHTLLVGGFWNYNHIRLEQEPQCSVEYGDPEHLEVKLQGEDIQRHLGEINRKIMETGILVYTVSPVETQRLEDAFIELTKGETQIV